MNKAENHFTSKFDRIRRMNNKIPHRTGRPSADNATGQRWLRIKAS